jgi:hypothetical protein
MFPNSRRPALLADPKLVVSAELFRSKVSKPGVVGN